MSVAISADPATTAQTAAVPFVANMAKIIEGPQRSIKALSDSGVFTDDDARGAALAAKRLNRALYADFSKDYLSEDLLKAIAKMQTAYRPLTKEKPFAELVENGTFTMILREYVEFLTLKNQEKLERLKSGHFKSEDERNPTLLNIKINDTKEELANLAGELETYQTGSDYTKNMLKRIEPAIKAGKYLGLADIVVACDLVACDGATPKERQEKAKDLVSDILSNMPALRLHRLARSMGDDKTLAGLAERSNDPNTQVLIKAKSEAVRQHTRSLSSLFDANNESAEVNRINALEQLVGGVLNKAFSQERSPEKTAELEQKALRLLKQASQAALSLSYEYLGNGPAKNDPRAKKMQSNLLDEMQRCDIKSLSLADAIRQAGDVASRAAADLLASIKEDPSIPLEEKKAMAQKIAALASMAGASIDQPIKPEERLIGLEFAKAVAPLLKNPNVILPADFMAKENQRRSPSDITPGLN